MLMIRGLEIEPSEISTNSLSRLVAKYSGQIPRYTSYPTAVEFSQINHAVWINYLTQFFSKRESRLHLSLYAHIPFCPSLCYFCACNKIITSDASVTAEYLSALKREIATYKDLVSSDTSTVQLHLGGGSPNFLKPSELEELFFALTLAFPIGGENADVSIELDPRTTSIEQLRVLRSLGFNRISLGVQDFSANVQQAINRIQSVHQTRTLCDVARDQGFKSINIDLIYGLPEQTVEGFDHTLNEVLAIRPDRIALYGYAHVTWKTKVQTSFRRFNLPKPEQRIEIFLRGLSRLTENGYRYIGMDHFALPGDDLSTALDNGTLNRNFMGYSTHRGAEVIGLGVSAISHVGEAFAQNATGLEQYYELIRKHGIATVKGLVRTADDSVRARLIRSVLCDGLITERETGSAELIAAAAPALAQMKDEGLIATSERAMIVTPLGRLFMRNIASLFDAHLVKHREEKAFSQSV